MKGRDFFKLVGITTAGAMVPITLNAKGFPVLPDAEGDILQTIDLTEGVLYYLSPEMKKVYKNLIPSMCTVFEWNRPIEDAIKLKKLTKDDVKEYNIDFYRELTPIQNLGVREINLKKACKKIAEIFTETHKSNKALFILGKPVAVELIDKSYACCIYVGYNIPIEEHEHMYQKEETPKATYDNPKDLNKIAYKEISEIIEKLDKGTKIKITKEL